MEFILLADITGIIAFALSGFIIASKANYDILGIAIITYISALGGGVIRDIITQTTPYIFSTTYPLLIVTILIFIGWLLKYHHKEHLNDNLIFKLADTLGLIIFSYIGFNIAIDNNYNLGGVISLGLISSVGGGVLRDILMNKTVYILHSGFYGIVSIIISISLYTAYIYGLPIYIDIIILLLNYILRLVAIKYEWRLPKLIND